MSTWLVEAHTMCSSLGEAHAIARAAVDARLCASAHVLPTASYYRWDGEVYDTTEVHVSFMTTQDRLADLQQLVTEEHSYELPAFYFVEIVGGSSDYLAWVANNSAST